MRNLARRIMALEQKAAAAQRRQEPIIDAVLGKLSSYQLESLITGFGGDQNHRPLTSDEVAAREAYWLALSQAHPQNSSRLMLIARVVPNENTIRRCTIIALARRFGPDELRLVMAALEARQQGTQPDDQGLAALQACNDYMRQLNVWERDGSGAIAEQTSGGAQ